MPRGGTLWATDMELSLNGEWRLFSEGEEVCRAQVPGCVYTDLLAAGKIEDPFYAENEQKAYWVSCRNWEYRKTFFVPEEALAQECVLLRADMPDTVCTFFVNGKEAGSAQNAHICHTFSVKELLRAGENELRILFSSPVEYVKRRQSEDECPVNWNGQRGINHIRKPQYHFGWDWAPQLPPVGIAGGLWIECRPRGSVSDFRVEQRHEQGRVTVTVRAAFADFEPAACEVYLTDPQGGRTVCRVRAEKGVAKARFSVEQPQLWYTHDLSSRKEQPLYCAGVRAEDARGHVLRSERRIGLRTVRLLRDKDEYGSNFCFELNGMRLFAKGANFIPPEFFINGYTADKMERDLRACLFSNFNMLRIWGGGYYPSESFLELCDRFGILVWQDFMFACQPYPFYNEAFLQNVEEEVRQTVRRMRHHACLALWCGNNETEAGANHWIHIDRFRNATRFFFWGRLPALLQELDGVTAYQPGSPVGDAFMENVESNDYGDNHLWQVWHGLKPLSYYKNCPARFCSEFGFESLPEAASLKAFMPSLPKSLRSSVLDAHQKCRGGNLRMEYYILSEYGAAKGTGGFIYLSQLCQEECVRNAVAFWRRSQHRCHGALYWQFNDCWPACSWAGKDYYGRYKALQYGARRFFAPVFLAVDDGDGEAADVYLINDTPRPVRGKLLWKSFDLVHGEDGFLQKELSVAAAPFSCLHAVRISRREALRRGRAGRAGLNVCFVSEEGEAQEQNVFFCKPTALRLPAAKLSVRCERENGALRVFVKSDRFAKSVCLSSESAEPFSDNFFDLLPGQEREIRCAADARAVRACSAADFIARGRGLYRRLRFCIVKFRLRKYPL